MKCALSLLTFCSSYAGITTINSNLNNNSGLSVYAYEFQNNEDAIYKKYMKKTSLSQEEKNEYDSFVSYLNQRIEEYRQQMETLSNSLNDTQKDDVATLQNSIEKLEQQIEESEEKIDTCKAKITETETKIEEKENILKDRMYKTQEFNNSNSYIDYVFGAENFADFLSRISGVNEITEYDNELIEELANYKKQIDKEQKKIETEKDNLTTSKNTQSKKLKKLEDFYAEQARTMQQTLNTSTSEYNKLSKMVDDLRVHREKVNQTTANIVKPTVNKPNNTNNSNNSNTNRPSTSGNSNSGNASKPSGGNTSNSSSGSNSSNSGNSGSTTPSTPSNGSTSVGTSIVNYALSKQGHDYVWGATGPNTFDCSGLVYWSHRQAGVMIPRYTSSGMNSAGKYVSRSDMQPGDVILFSNNGAASGIHHVGIYIGGNKMVHAAKNR